MKNKIILSFILCFCSTFLFAQPNADFTASATEGCSPLEVTFTDSSTGSGLTYVWDFGDGNTSTEMNPTIVYFVEGDYTVCLTVTDDQGEDDQVCMTDLISVYPSDETYLSFTLCPETSIIVGGIEYNAANPTGTEILTTESGCDSIIYVELSFLPPSVNNLDLTLCEDDFVTVEGTIYDVNNPSGTEVIANGDMYGCDSILNINLSFVPADEPFLLDTEIVEPSCGGASNGFICLNVICGLPPYDYSWSPTGETGVCLVDVPAGSYTVTVTDANGNSVEEFYTLVGGGSVVSYNATFVDVSCNGGSDGGIQLTNISGGCEPYTIEWNTGATGENIVNLAAGAYSVTVTDCAGCSQVNFYTINEPSPLSLVADNIQCATPGQNDGAIYLDSNIGGTAPYTFLWSDGQVSQDLINLSAGIYFVTVTDFNDCEAVASFVTNEDLIQSITQSTTVCLFENIQLEVVAPSAVSYSWEPANLLDDPTIANPIGSVENTTQTFTVTVTNAAGCEDTDLVVIDTYNGLTLEGTVTNASCSPNEDGEIAVTAFCGTPPYTYAWGPGTPMSDVLTDLAIGNYTITVTDALGETAVEIFTVLEDANIVTEFTAPATVCEGEQLSLCADSPTGIGYEYLWTGPAGFTSTDICATISVMDEAMEGCYTLEVVNAQGCTGSVTHCIDVTSFSDVVSAPIFDASICDGGSHQFNVDAPTAVGITWSPAIGLSCTDCYDPVASPSATTEYTVVIETVDGCAITRSVTVEVGIESTINVVAPLLVCAGVDFGACVTVDAGPNDMESWVWLTPLGPITTLDECLNIPDVSAVNEGLYEVTVTFVGGCTATSSFNLGVETVDFTISDDVTACIDDPVQLLVSGGSSLTATWSNDGSLNCDQCPDPVAVPFETTTYTVIVSGVSGCTAEGQVTVTIDENCVWPGDTDTNKVVNNYDLLNIGLAYDSIGPVRPSANLLWVGQMGPDWMQAAPNGSNYKHIDTDGNGLIDANDTLAISQNWGSVHNFTGTNDSGFAPTFPPASGADLTIPFYVQPDTLIEGAMISLPVILGESGNPAEDVYGIAFTLEYDTAVVVPGSVSMGFDQSWLGESDDDLISIHRDFFADNKVDIGMTRIDGMPMTNFGTLASLFITVEDDLLFNSGNSSGFGATQDEAVFNITNVLVVNHLGEEITVIPTQTTAPVVVTTSTHNPNLEDYISIFPNPTTDLLWVNTKNIKLSKIELLNVSGQKVGEVVTPDSRQKMDLSQMAVGTYFVKVYSEEGVYVERVILMR